MLKNEQFFVFVILSPFLSKKPELFLQERLLDTLCLIYGRKNDQSIGETKNFQFLFHIFSEFCVQFLSYLLHDLDIKTQQ